MPLRHRRYPYSLNSKTSPGWHSKALQTASNVENRIAFALPFFNTEILAIVMPTRSASSVTLIFRFANMTSMLMMIAIALYGQVVLGLQVHGILQKPLEHGRRSGDYDRGKDHHDTQ